MIAIVEHKNGDRRSVRDDLAMEYVACVTCKGRGMVWLREGGDLYARGWQVNRQWYCHDCAGAGIYRCPQEGAAPHE